MDNQTAAPWERQPGETMRQYEHFCAYRDMRYLPAANADAAPKLNPAVRKRSIRKLAETLGLTRRTIGNLSTRWNWQARCDAYDLHILRQQRDAFEAKRLKMLENHAAVGEQMVRRGLRRILSLKDDEIEAADAIRMADVGAKIERLSREGLLTESGSAVSGAVGEAISDATRDAVEEAVNGTERKANDYLADDESC